MSLFSKVIYETNFLEPIRERARVTTDGLVTRGTAVIRAKCGKIL